MFKNLPVAKKFNLGEFIGLEEGKTISNNILSSDIELTLLSLAKGENISESKMFKDSILLVLEGSLLLRINGEEHLLGKGDFYTLEALSVIEMVGLEGVKLLKIDFESKLEINGFKNIDYFIKVLKDQVVNLTFYGAEKSNLAVLALDKDEKLSTHAASGDALVYVVDGEVEIIIDQEEYILAKGDSIIMPKNIPHSLLAKEEYRMLLVISR